VNCFGGTLNILKTSLSNVLIMDREMVTLSNSLLQFRLFYQDPLRKHVQGGFLQKDENEGWNLYENLAEKTIQWEPTTENSRNSSSISSKGGLHSIESFITVDARIVNLARRLKALQSIKLAQTNFQLRLHLLSSHETCV